MESNKITALINQLREPGELNGIDRESLIKVLQSHEEKHVCENLIDSLVEISRGVVTEKCWECFFKDSFKKLGTGIGADRICYYENTLNDEDVSGLKLMVTWESDYALQSIGKIKKDFLQQSLYNDLFARLNTFSPFQEKSLSQKSPVKSLFDDGGIKTILFLPIRINGTLYGFIRIDSCKMDRVWSEREISLLQPIVFQVRNLLEKRDMEDQLHSTYQQAQIGTWEMNLENSKFYWSPITREVFEIDEDTEPSFELALTFLDDDEVREKLLNAVERAQLTGEPYDLELPVRTAKGNIKWIRDTGQAQFKNGKCVRLYGIVQDIHKRKLAELESEKNKQLLKALTQQADVAVWVRNNSGEIIFVNDEWRNIFGLNGEQLTNKSLYNILDKDLASEMVASDQRVIESNKQVVFEETVNTAKGKRHYMVNKFPLKGISGLDDAVGGIGTDITEIKETEEKLQKAEQKLREIIEHSTNLFYTHDTDHRLTYLSPQSVDFLGYAPEDAKRRWTEFVTDHPVNIRGGESTQRAIDTGIAQPPFELQLIRGDGKIIWVEVNEAPVLKNGKTVSVAGSLTDITDRKKAQEAIRASLKEKETLLAEIHHRVKNNLAVVASLMQLQAMESDNPEIQVQLIESVLRIKSMASIHEHLYKTDNFSKIDFGGNLEGLVTDIINTLQYSTRIQLFFGCDEVYLNVNQAIPSSLVINEVITNIVKHGFKGRESGNINVKLNQEGARIQVMIEDNGNGFPDDFDPESGKTLGMQLIKTLTMQLEGRYYYEPLDEGVRFVLEFESDKLPE